MKRPFGVTLMSCLVLSLIVWSTVRLIAIVRWWRILQIYSHAYVPLYVSCSALVWLAVGLVLLWGIKEKKNWILNALIGTGACYMVWYWIDRFFIQWQHENWLFALSANILLLVLGMISVTDTKTKIFLNKKREIHDR